jgi:hypothetical protein
MGSITLGRDTFTSRPRLRSSVFRSRGSFLDLVRSSLLVRPENPAIHPPCHLPQKRREGGLTKTMNRWRDRCRRTGEDRRGEERGFPEEEEVCLKGYDDGSLLLTCTSRAMEVGDMGIGLACEIAAQGSERARRGRGIEGSYATLGSAAPCAPLPQLSARLSPDSGLIGWAKSLLQPDFRFRFRISCHSLRNDDAELDRLISDPCVSDLGISMHRCVLVARRHIVSSCSLTAIYRTPSCSASWMS